MKRGDEGFELRAAGPVFTIRGGGPLGRLFAAYEFLRRFGGCRFSDLGPDGEHVPRLPWIEAPKDPLRMNPRLWYRGLQFIYEEDPDLARRRLDWMARNGLNYVTYRLFWEETLPTVEDEAAFNPPGGRCDRRITQAWFDREYLLGAFGSAAPKVRPIFEGMLDKIRALAWGDSDLLPNADNVRVFFGAEPVQQAEAALSSARRQAADERERRQVEKLAAAVCYWSRAALISANPGLVDPERGRFELLPESPARGAGVHLPGVTTVEPGTTPDLGAARGAWKPGHDFENPPDVGWDVAEVAYSNVIRNAAFELGSLEYWTTGKSGTASISPGNGWGNAFGRGDVQPTGTSKHELKLIGRARVEQTIENLHPHTRYQLSGWLKVSEHQATVVLGGTGHGGLEITVSFSDPGWVRKTVDFTTGPSATRATVFVQGAFDRERRSPTILGCRATCRQNKQFGLWRL